MKNQPVAYVLCVGSSKKQLLDGCHFDKLQNFLPVGAHRSQHKYQICNIDIYLYIYMYIYI